MFMALSSLKHVHRRVSHAQVYQRLHARAQVTRSHMFKWCSTRRRRCRGRAEKASVEANVADLGLLGFIFPKIWRHTGANDVSKLFQCFSDSWRLNSSRLAPPQWTFNSDELEFFIEKELSDSAPLVLDSSWMLRYSVTSDQNFIETILCDKDSVTHSSYNLLCFMCGRFKFFMSLAGCRWRSATELFRRPTHQIRAIWFPSTATAQINTAKRKSGSIFRALEHSK